MRLAFLTHWISNRGGGIPAVVSATCRALESVDDIEVHVIGLSSSDSDFKDHEWGSAKVHGVYPLETRLLGYAPGMDSALHSIRPDVVHVHGLWTYATIAAERWRSNNKHGRVIVSPHGMLEPWALSHAGWKKIIAGRLFQRRALSNAACVHALTLAEADEIQSYCGSVPVAVIPNGVTTGESISRSHTPHWRSQLPADVRILLYLGRVHPKKNLKLLLNAWARVGAAKDGWNLVIAGWDQADHLEEIQNLSRKLSINQELLFIGPQFGADKDATYAAADAFVLPSVSEGLPMVVLEAWAHRLPVLMTEACNLSVGFTEGAASLLHTELQAATCDLGAFLESSEEKLAAMGTSGEYLARTNFGWDEVARQFRAIYEKDISRQNQGSSIVVSS